MLVNSLLLQSDTLVEEMLLSNAHNCWPNTYDEGVNQRLEAHDEEQTLMEHEITGVRLQELDYLGRLHEKLITRLMRWLWVYDKMALY